MSSILIPLSRRSLAEKKLISFKGVKLVKSDQRGLMKHIPVSSAAQSDFFPFVSAVLKLFPICKDPKIASQLSVPASIRPHDSVRSACGMQ